MIRVSVPKSIIDWRGLGPEAPMYTFLMFFFSLVMRFSASCEYPIPDMLAGLHSGRAISFGGFGVLAHDGLKDMVHTKAKTHDSPLIVIMTGSLVFLL